MIIFHLFCITFDTNFIYIRNVFLHLKNTEKMAKNQSCLLLGFKLKSNMKIFVKHSFKITSIDATLGTNQYGFPLSAYIALGVRDGCYCCVLCSTPTYILFLVVMLLKGVTYVQVFAAWLYLFMFKLSTKIVRLCYFFR